jgi:HEAT repeat protein
MFFWFRLRQIESRDRVTRTRGAEALGRSRDPRAVEPLIKLLLEGGFFDDRSIAREALTQLGPIAVDALVQVLRDRHPMSAAFLRNHDFSMKDTVREVVIHVLGSNAGDARVMEPLLEVMRERRMGRHLREKAASALDRLGFTLSDRDAAVKATLTGDWQTAVSLGSIAVEALVEEMVRAEKDRYAGDSIPAKYEEEVIAALRAIGPPAVAEFARIWDVTRPLSDRFSDLFRELGDPAAVPILVKALEQDIGYQLWQPALRALVALSPDTAIQVIAGVLKKRDDYGETAVNELAAIPGEPTERLLENALTNSNPHTRWAAAHAFRRINVQRAREAFVSMITRGPETGRISHEPCDELGEIGDASSVAHLLAFLTSNNRSGRIQSAAVALTRILERDAARVSSADLRSLASLRDLTWVDYALADDTRGDRTIPLSCAELRRLADEELTRRAPGG